MPYKKEYHTFKCPMCKKEYRVLTPAYLRKIRDTVYGSYCSSCRAKVQYENMTDEQKKTLQKKANDGKKKYIDNLSEDKKKELIDKRTQGTKKYWKNMTEEEKKQKSEKRSKDRIDFINSITEEEWKLIGEKISSARKNFFNNMTEEERLQWTKDRQEERRKYFLNMSDEDYKKMCNNLKKAVEKLWTEMTPKELAKRSKTMTERNIEFWSNITEEEKIAFGKNISEKGKERWNNMSAEEKSMFIDKIKEGLNNMSEEDRINMIQQRRESLRLFWANASDELHEAMSNRMKNYWANIPDEKRKEIAIQNHLWYHELSDDEKEEYAKLRSDWYNNLSEEKKNEIKERMHDSVKSYWADPKNREAFSLWSKQYWANLTKEEREKISERVSKRMKENWKDENYRARYSESRRKWWESLSNEEKAVISSKRFSSAGKKSNKFNEAFENMFDHSTLLKSKFYILREIDCINEDIHHWDYGIYDINTNELVMVVDLDGAYYHANNTDYDGIHSHEELDESRFLSVPDGVKYHIINEFSKTSGFSNMIKFLMDDYESFINDQIEICRETLFPYPKYHDDELLKSWRQLCNLKYIENSDNPRKNTNLSIRNREGDRLITHFHPSIYHAHVKNKLSPYNAWYNDDLLRKCIENRIVYVDALNLNKILQGFNVSKIAPKVSVFSAGRAKLIINKYLSEYDTIFDPFSGFSGRMLGAISLGKRYIGYDLSEVHVKESNDIIEFLGRKFDIFDILDNMVSIKQGNVLDIKTTMYYPCLFTCPPYYDKEEWFDENDPKSCDEWIDICLNNFKCNRYVFIVDNTEKYKNNIVYEIYNKSHFNKNSEYIIMINK